MRIDLAPVIEAAETLVKAIELEQRGPARDAAHLLICTMPMPSWGDPAPGVTILYGPEVEIAPDIEVLRFSACTWLKWLASDEINRKWPEPEVLRATISHLRDFVPQNASVS